MAKKQQNRRKKPVTRTKMGNCQGFVTKGSIRFEVEVVDQDHGGMGIIIPKKMILNLGDELKVEFPLMPEEMHIDLFRVVEINKNRIGLQYADKSSISPRQRWNAWVVNKGKKKERKNQQKTQTPKGLAGIIYLIKGLL